VTSRLLNAAAKLGLCGAAGGALVAGITLPLVSGAGLTAKHAAAAFSELPPPPRDDGVPELTRVLDRHGRQIAQFYYQNRQSVPLSRVAPVMRQAILAIEDARFYQHGGLDIRGTLRALIANTRAGTITQGGSSITQQLVKNILITQAETDRERLRASVRSIQRKIDELRYALALERKYTKDQILERYLNIAYFGAGSFGVQAAARRFFSVDAADLTLTQAATLAGAVRTPSDTDPTLGAEHRARLLERRNLVLRRMAELKMITPEQAAAAIRAPLGLRMRPQQGGCESSPHPFFCVYVEREVLTNPAFGPDRASRERRLQRGGLTIWTTLDPVAQRAAEKAISARVWPQDTQVAAEAMVEPGTGYIRALATSKRYGRNPRNRPIGPRTTYNLAADQAHGGGLGLQAGSTFKVFTLATALSQGMRFGDGFQIPSTYVPDSGYRDCSGKPVNAPGTRIRNAGGEGRGGPYSLEMATWHSVNVFFIKLERQVGLCNVVKTAKALGVRRADGAPLREVPTFTLGVNEMDPTTMAAAFATFAARGRYCRPMAITAIVERDGTRTEIPPSCSTALDPEVADAVNHVLSGVFTKGTMRGQSIGRPAAGKTGTSNGYTSAWFAGYTPALAAAVSVGDIRGSYRYPLTGVTIGGRYYAAVQGASLPGAIWVDSMRAALRHTPPLGFVPPDMRRFGGGFTPGLKEYLEKQAEKARKAREKQKRKKKEQERREEERRERETATAGDPRAADRPGTEPGRPSASPSTAGVRASARTPQRAERPQRAGAASDARRGGPSATARPRHAAGRPAHRASGRQRALWTAPPAASRRAVPRSAAAPRAGSHGTRAHPARSHDTRSRPARSQDARSQPARSRDPRSRPARPHGTRSRPARSQDARSQPARSRDARSQPARPQGTRSRQARAPRTTGPRAGTKRTRPQHGRSQHARSQRARSQRAAAPRTRSPRPTASPGGHRATGAPAPGPAVPNGARPPRRTGGAGDGTPAARPGDPAPAGTPGGGSGAEAGGAEELLEVAHEGR